MKTNINLTKSETYKQYADASGMCTQCYEHTSVLSPCCGQSVEFEGGSVHGDDIISDIAFDLECSEEEVLDLLD